MSNATGSDAVLVRRLLGYLRPYRGWAASSVVLLLAHSGLGIVGKRELVGTASDMMDGPQQVATLPTLDDIMVAVTGHSTMPTGFVAPQLEAFIHNQTWMASITLTANSDTTTDGQCASKFQAVHTSPPEGEHTGQAALSPSPFDPVA